MLWSLQTGWQGELFWTLPTRLGLGSSNEPDWGNLHWWGIVKNIALNFHIMEPIQLIHFPKMLHHCKSLFFSPYINHFQLSLSQLISLNLSFPSFAFVNQLFYFFTLTPPLEGVERTEKSLSKCTEVSFQNSQSDKCRFCSFLNFAMIVNIFQNC